MPSKFKIPQVQATSYTSKDVEIPSDFLKTDPADAKPLTISQLDFKKLKLPEYSNCFAVVLDNVLSVSECDVLQKYAEASAEGQGWRPALVNAGYGREALIADYRNSDRIIWDSNEMVSRLWDRCAKAPGLEDALSTVQNNPYVQGHFEVTRGIKWKKTRLNERMRFLRYGKGHFFDKHCDGTFAVPNHPKQERSLYTLHLYLNSTDNVKGGTTRFFSLDEKKYYDVKPVPGRVLIFQHRSLLHSGEPVKRGLKYTMRTDIMYELDLGEDNDPSDSEEDRRVQQETSDIVFGE